VAFAIIRAAMSDQYAGSLPPPLPGAPAPRPWILAGLTVLVYVGSLFPSALYLENNADWTGGAVLSMGWLGPLIGQFGWLANLPWLVALVLLLFRFWTPAFILSLLAVLVGLSSLTFVHKEMLLDEAGVKKAIVLGLGPAFYLWMVALALPAVIAVLGRRRMTL
jgi:hypothetical protein